MDSSMRVSDADRERTAQMLRTAVGDGRLTLADVDERLRAAYAAVTRAELERVTADLPVPARSKPAPARAAGGQWTDAWRAWLGGALIMIGIWAATSPANGAVDGFWPAIPVGIWAAVLVVSMVSGKQPHAGCTARRSVRPPR